MVGNFIIMIIIIINDNVENVTTINTIRNYTITTEQ